MEDDFPIVVFEPQSHHEVALESYVESGGNLKVASKASGMSYQMILQLTRREWWSDGLSRLDFKPITAEDIGEAIAMQAGHEVLDRLTGDTYVSNNDLVKMGKYGREMHQGREEGGINIKVGNLNMIDLRDMNRGFLQSLRDGAPDIVDID